MEGVFYMQSSTFGRLCITQRIDLRGTYTCPKKGVHYTIFLSSCMVDMNIINYHSHACKKLTAFSSILVQMQ